MNSRSLIGYWITLICAISGFFVGMYIIVKNPEYQAYALFLPFAYIAAMWISMTFANRSYIYVAPKHDSVAKLSKAVFVAGSLVLIVTSVLFTFPFRLFPALVGIGFGVLISTLGFLTFMYGDLMWFLWIGKGRVEELLQSASMIWGDQPPLLNRHYQMIENPFEKLYLIPDQLGYAVVELYQIGTGHCTCDVLHVTLGGQRIPGERFEYRQLHDVRVVPMYYYFSAKLQAYGA